MANGHRIAGLYIQVLSACAHRKTRWVTWRGRRRGRRPRPTASRSAPRCKGGARHAAFSRQPSNVARLLIHAAAPEPLAHARRTCAGEPVGDVALPPWAADAADCVAQLAAALEAPHVSARLHLWIDLVFGCASRGPAAERADNVFHYLTYDDMCAATCLSLSLPYPNPSNHYLTYADMCAACAAGHAHVFR